MSWAVGTFVFLIFVGVPIGLVMVAAGLAGAVSFGGIDFLEIIADRFTAGVSGFVLIAVPYFVFTAEVMNRSGLTDRMVAFANSLFGRVPGALSHVNIAVSVFFAGITGAAVTDTVAIGKTLIPAMKREGYGAAYSAAVTACSSIIGPIIPPSVIMIVYATTLRDVSVLQLFAAGVVPGLLMAAALLVASGYISWKRGYAGHEPIRIARILATGIATLPVFGIPIIIIGGILSGITTLTEAGALGALYSFALGYFVYRSLSRRDIWEALVNTVSFSGVVFLLLGASTVLGWYVTRSGIARDAAEAIKLVSSDPLIQILVVNLLLIALGMVIDVLPAVVVAAPVLAPAMISLGFDPLHFGIVMLLALNLGNITPPVGMTIITAAKIADVQYEAVIKESIPFMASHLVVIAVASASPTLILWFPKLIGAIG